ncbi:hypothetical protein ACO0K9_16275 [Undibacterium sp. Ji50W]|uniref:hypothetical protein n=1 Tax=Undibacterium sp. Ji50W TaxID=3413041 RepID=UPI003BF2F2CE
MREYISKSFGYRLQISADTLNGEGGACLHYSGAGNIKGAPDVACPNCANPLFPALNLCTVDPRVRKLIAWPGFYIHVLFCPFCAFYMEPYWIRQQSGNLEIVGGELDGGEILQNINVPYEARKLTLRELASNEYPTKAGDAKMLISRKINPGVYHQLGGAPILATEDGLLCCDCDSEMGFLGILDYDDLNVPLFEENHKPVALIVGDYGQMNIFACVKCSIIGMKWAY